MDGNFDVLFNITLPRSQQPYPRLVRESFIPGVILDHEDLATQDDAESAHGVIPSASVELTSKRVDSHRQDQTPSRYATFLETQRTEKQIEVIEGLITN